MKFNLPNTVSCSLMSVVSLFAFAKNPTISEIPIETEFGITLGTELDPNLIAEVFEKEHWKTNGSYRLSRDSPQLFSIGVHVTSENKIYSIWAFKELKDCEIEFQVLRQRKAIGVKSIYNNLMSTLTSVTYYK